MFRELKNFLNIKSTERLLRKSLKCGDLKSAGIFQFVLEQLENTKKRGIY